MASIHAATTAGDAETLVWSQTGTNLNFNKYFYGAPGTYYRGCVTISAHTVNIWGKSAIMGLGSSAGGDIGPHTATLSPGGRPCGDSGMGPVWLTGTATTGVTWYINVSDQDYAFVGRCSPPAEHQWTPNSSPDLELTVLEVCVHNSSQQTITAAYELLPAQ
jgi:hypothetical protein